MSGIFRILLYGIQGFRRNIWLSVIAIITMTMTIVTITIFALGDVVANKKYQEFNGKIDYNVFIKDTASDADVASFKQQVEARPEVAHMDYISKEDALARFNKEFQSDANLKGIVSSEDNPLPREVDVKFKGPEQIESFNTFITQERYAQVVENTSYQNNHNLISNYLRLTNFLKAFGVSFTAFFVMIAILVVLNTIRLTIFSRREEIEIMRLVGATSGYIRGPFLIEGVLFGLLGALFSGLLAWIFLYQMRALLQQGSANFISDLFGSVFSDVLTGHAFNTLFSQIVALQIAVGVALGLICSFIAVRRYLKE